MGIFHFVTHSALETEIHKLWRSVPNIGDLESVTKIEGSFCVHDDVCPDPDCLMTLMVLLVSFLSGSARAKLVSAPSPVPNITRVPMSRLRLDTQRRSPDTTYLKSEDIYTMH